MITIVELKSYKGLSQAQMKDLGHLNVLCGRNNSGKTTLLEALNHKDLRRIGLRLTQDEITALARTCFKSPGSSVLDEEIVTRMAQVFKNILQDRVWFEDEATDFSKTARERGQNIAQSQHSEFDLPQAHQAFRKQFQDIQSVLLPSKRSLQSKVPLQSNDAGQPNGHGITNALFRAQNANEGSDIAKTLTCLRKVFRDISKGCDFRIVLEGDNKIALRFLSEGSWYDADDCGLGLQDLLVILYFTMFSPAQLVLIEEPESHLHADVQRRLLFYLKEYKHKQFLLSTHSNVFLDLNIVDKAFVTHYDKKVDVRDVSSKAIALQDLGFSVADNLVSDLVILTEGPYDKSALEVFLRRLGILATYNIRIWFLGGDTMDRADLEVFAQGYRIVVLLDKDPSSSKKRRRFVKECEKFDIPVTILKRYAIENYYSINAYRKVFGSQLSPSLQAIDPDHKVEKQIGLDPKKRTSHLAEATELEEINQSDLGVFLERVKKMCES